MRTISSTHTAQSAAAKGPSPRVLVPTMGALHAGHAELLRKARTLAGRKGTLMVSIFVNPIQFGPNEDLNSYPRPRTADLRLCKALGVDLVFAPTPEEMYAGNHSAFVDEQRLSAGLCGASRPGHFRGVCTVVTKLFNILQPQAAVFGEKDYQQLAIVRRMVRDLNFPIKIVGVPTVREPDGLALSSRNTYLSAEDRQAAPILRKALVQARESVQSGETSVDTVTSRARILIERETPARIDYVEIVHAETLEKLTRIEPPAVMALAAFFGRTRLIDNIRLT
ncbi:MAG TPA: pantoate--beta-alanine ligase [Chthoniobacterales bacterium]